MPARRTLATVLGGIAGAVVAGCAVLAWRRRLSRRPAAQVDLGAGERTRRTPPATHRPVARRSRLARNAGLGRLGVSVGTTYATTAARKVFASAERRIELDERARLQTAEAVTERLGEMKGALMKLGQMASFLDDDLPEPMRRALAELQHNAPPMSAELAAQVIRDEFGADPEQVFAEWDPEPIAAASIGQVHRAIIRDPRTGQERAVAVKVQYPGVDEAIAADLSTANVLGLLLAQGFGGLDPTDLVTEIKTRLVEELDYRREATNQQGFADYFRDHPTIHVPDVVTELSTGRVLTSDLVSGARFDEVTGWPQSERDLAAETIFRFVFRSLYRHHAFNGDPHPGNYLFGPGGKVTFLDFGLVRYFSEQEMATFQQMVTTSVIAPDPAAYRAVLEDAGLLRPDAPVSTTDVAAYFSRFYAPVSEDRAMTWTSEYASGIVRHVFDRSSPIAQWATVPRSFVFIQRINLGLYALLGRLQASGNYRRIAEELWPMTAAPPSTAMGHAEAEWIRRRSPSGG